MAFRAPAGDLWALSLTELARGIVARALSPVEVVEAALDRIERLNPVLNAYLAINPQARPQARLAEQALTARRRLGRLHGVPLSVKDIMLTRDMPTTAGSRALADHLPSGRDALVVRRLRRAGAIVLGKTNLHEIAMGVTTVNEHFGPARNPWDHARIAGGSSGGSAVAVAAGLDWGSIGTDTRGSIRIPAAACGVTGLKPSFGLVPTEGVIPLSPSLDHVGPVARTAADAALLLGALTGREGLASRWLSALEQPVAGLRLGVCDAWLRDLDPPVASAIESAITWFRDAGCAIRPVQIEDLAAAHEASAVITAAEAIAWHEEHLQRNPRGYGPRVRARLERGREITALAYLRATATQRVTVLTFHRLFREVDALVAAVLPFPPPRIDQDREVLAPFTRLNAPMNLAGVPALALPCGSAPGGLPLGMQLVAARGREDLLFRLAAAYQRETDWHTRRPPLRDRPEPPGRANQGEGDVAGSGT